MKFSTLFLQEFVCYYHRWLAVIIKCDIFAERGYDVTIVRSLIGEARLTVRYHNLLVLLHCSSAARWTVTKKLVCMTEMFNVEDNLPLL